MPALTGLSTRKAGGIHSVLLIRETLEEAGRECLNHAQADTFFSADGDENR